MTVHDLMYATNMCDCTESYYDLLLNSCANKLYDCDISKPLKSTALPNKPTQTEDNLMKKYKILDYKVYNEKIVILTFEDNTEERAVCCDEDNFDLERGIEVCVLKHLLGRDKYKSFLKDAMRQVKAVDVAKEEDKKQKEIIKAKKESVARKKARYRANKRAKRIAEMKEAYLSAMKECGHMCNGCIDSWDDLK